MSSIFAKGARKSSAVEVNGNGEPILKAKRPLNAWQAWTKHVLVTYAREYEAFAAAQEHRRGVAIKFANHMRETQPEEFAEFVRDFESTHTSITKFGKAVTMAHGAAGAGTPEPDIHRIAHELHSLASELESMSGGAHNKTRRNQKKRRTTRRR